MVPYFEIPPLHIGPIAVQSFGVLAAAGVAVASWLLVREAARRRLDTHRCTILFHGRSLEA